MASTDERGSIFWLLEVVEEIACHCLVWETIATLAEGHGYVRTCAEIDMFLFFDTCRSVLHVLQADGDFARREVTVQVLKT